LGGKGEPGVPGAKVGLFHVGPDLQMVSLWAIGFKGKTIASFIWPVY